MEIDWDPAKDDTNREVHGVALSDAVKLNWDAMLVKEDDRKAYGETRYIGYAPITRRLYCVAFTRRGDVFRIISLRKANSREVAAYEAAQTD